jgi:hypothetical protein
MGLKLLTATLALILFGCLEDSPTINPPTKDVTPTQSTDTIPKKDTAKVVLVGVYQGSLLLGGKYVVSEQTFTESGYGWDIYDGCLVLIRTGSFSLNGSQLNISSAKTSIRGSCADNFTVIGENGSFSFVLRNITQSSFQIFYAMTESDPSQWVTFIRN